MDARTACGYVDRLTSLQAYSDQPYLEPHQAAIAIEEPITLNYGDAMAWDGIEAWGPETQRLAELVKHDRMYNSRNGQYGWLIKGICRTRCLDTVKVGSRTCTPIAAVQERYLINEQTNRGEINKRLYLILEPEVEKLRQLFEFATNATKTIATICKEIISTQNQGFASSTMYITLAKTIDMLLVLDSLKNMKSSLINDISIHKRAVANIRKDHASEIQLPADDPREVQALYSLLQRHNAFIGTLTEDLRSDKALIEVLINCANVCAHSIENHLYLSSKAKHMLIKAMVVIVDIVDNIWDDKADKAKTKRPKFERQWKIFKTLPTLPLFADMSLSIQDVFAKSVNPASKSEDWDAESVLFAKYDLIQNVEAIKHNYKQYMYEFTSVLNNRPDLTVLTVEPLTMYNVILKGLQILTELTSRVLEHNAWKTAHPANPSLNPKVPGDATVYELAIKHNYSHLERLVVVEFVSMIQTLASVMLTNKNEISYLVRRACETLSNNFITSGLKDLISVSVKKKKSNLRELKLLWEFTSGDADASSALSLTEVHFMRFVLEHSCGDKISRGKDKDYKEAQLNELDTFLERSGIWDQVWDFEGVVKRCSDLSDLWFKEFYLELSKQVQFPISMSLPWILVSRLLEVDATEQLEYVFYPFGIYNDAGQRILNDLKCRYLFDELEAEVNLAFVQLVFELGQKVFSHYKQAASSMMIDKYYKNHLESLQGGDEARYDCPKRTYETLLRQKHIQILGRSIDLNDLLTQSCNQAVRKSIDVAISRFEIVVKEGIQELESLLSTAKLTHHTLSAHLHLDPWKDMYEEVDESSALSGSQSRVVSHILQELTADFLPNWCYNSTTSRFVPAPIILGETTARSAFTKEQSMHLYGTKHLFTAFSALHQLHKNIVSIEHVASMQRVIGRKDISTIIAELRKFSAQVLDVELTPYITALNKGMPYMVKLPPLEFGTKGTMEYFQVVLKPLLQYPDMRTGIHQSFRVLGNALIFTQMMENVASEADTSDLWFTSTCMGDAHQSTLSEMVSNNKLQHIVSYMSQSRPQMIAQSMQSSFNLSMFANTHIYLKKPLFHVRERWENIKGAYKDGIQNAEDQNPRFYRAWAVIMFALNLPSMGATETSNRALFGDGPIYAGMCLIRLLDEHDLYFESDFSRYVQRISDIEGKIFKEKEAVIDGRDLALFLTNAKLSSEIEDRIHTHYEKLTSVYAI